MSFQPRRLNHDVPDWVPDGSAFHVRIRAKTLLTSPAIGQALLDAARNYHERHRWYCRLILLMPDHLHALLAFPPQESVAGTVGSWKQFGSRRLGIEWQEDFFDHRLRNDHEFGLKWNYILKNPVVKGLCARPEGWPWVWQGGAGCP